MTKKEEKPEEPKEEAKAEAKKGKYVKLEKDGGVKLQDNPDRIKELEKAGWKVVK